MAALDRTHSFPDGGELTGVLFGTHNGEELRIRAERLLPAEIQLRNGPLSNEERAALAAVAAAAQSPGELAGLEPVGWFRSHPRSELRLSERDLEIANSLFPHPWQIAMILRPSASTASSVRFFFREPDAAMTAASPFQEFLVPLAPVAPPAPEVPPADDVESEADLWGPPRAEAKLVDDLRAAVGAREDIRERAPEKPVPSDLTRSEASVLPPRRPYTRRLPVAYAWLALLITAAGLMAALYWLAWPPARLALRVVDSAGQLHITWDPVQKFDRAHLEITDGNGKLWVELDPALVRNGSFAYARRTGNVTVRLLVERRGRAPLEEATRFVGPEGEATDVRAAFPAEAASPVERKQPNLVSRPPEKPAELIVSVPIHQPTPPKARPIFRPPALPASRQIPANKLSAPEPGPPQVVARDASSAAFLGPTRVAPPPAERPSAAGPSQQLNAPPSTAVQQAQSQPVAPPRAPAAPASGRIIWIGRLQKNQPLTISGKNCSSGTLIGELPARPVKFSVSPGDLSSDGMVLYTSNLQYANNVVEPPGAHNGWNKTVYTWNPKLAGDVALEEAPAARNQWSRMVLRSKNPKISVIVIDWSTAN